MTKILSVLLLSLTLFISAIVAHADPSVGAADCGNSATFAPGSTSSAGTIYVGTGDYCTDCYFKLAPAGYYATDPTCLPDYSAYGVHLSPLAFQGGDGAEYLDFAADDTLVYGDSIQYSCQ